MNYYIIILCINYYIIIFSHYARWEKTVCSAKVVIATVSEIGCEVIFSWKLPCNVQ